MTDEFDDDLPEVLPEPTESITIHITPGILTMFAHVAHLQGISVHDVIRDSAWLHCKWWMTQFENAPEEGEQPTESDIVH
ncbi:MAG: hypothetical protein GY807_21815 [Gammaproteobacteria bacterium]|nr:hypothetical protein [Gammaproteobacteria bacterium]